MRPCATPMLQLLEQLELGGADHLYIERFDQPGVTGDARDLLAALRACWLDDPLAAEHSLASKLLLQHRSVVGANSDSRFAKTTIAVGYRSYKSANPVCTARNAH